MNDKTAEHYNKLLKLATPATLNETGDIRLRHDYCRGTLQARANDIMNKYIDAAIAAELAEAASEKREAAVFIGESYERKTNNPTRAEKKLWVMAQAEVRAMVEADNARRLEDYERYRLACAQGVAVPPSDKEV